MRIMIIGGTSGIDLALGAHYAAQGAHLALCGRDTGRLDGHALAASPRVRRYGFDIADSAAVKRALQDFGREGLDMLVVTAGRYADAAGLRRSLQWDPRWCRPILSGWSRHSTPLRR